MYLSKLPNVFVKKKIYLPASKLAFKYEPVAVVLLPELWLLDEGGSDVLPGGTHPQGFERLKAGTLLPKQPECISSNNLSIFPQTT